ncbi:pimeloyl-ACP methyl ester carboxylesterase [Catenuloplanes nepalensis]|uniref:Pimeloyl-ACP methyl ester carboxylesterase n=1 Tax=Catenuloplanes nepalensis TaxID=587533 RepID=A0ABT9MUH9_9ACTN|nr:alpha/beta hydrolase [Catenuloplanes nepalensis]MDP9795084.1 pimeloyl-ACP methyl ester carboxylesterase [Catenuloplanes nepalensis]
MSTGDKPEEQAPPVRKRRRVLRWTLGGIAAVLVLVVVVAAVRLGTPLRADEARFAEVAAEVVDAGDGLVMRPAAASTGDGIVFIPGARVEAEAYAWTLASLVDAGTTVIIVRPTFRFAILDTRELSTFTALAPEVTRWAVAGHSLGGVRACEYAADEPNRVTGLLLLGSYCNDDISGSPIPVLSVGGSRDGLSTPQDIQDAAHLLPDDADLVEIEGMNHSQFGAYGDQDGDGTATIDDEAARVALAEAVTGP